MNMVRAGVVGYPCDWEWCGFREIARLRQRNRIIDQDSLADKLNLGNIGQLRELYTEYINETLSAGRSKREPKWTESLAVGSEGFVRQVAENLPRRQRIQIIRPQGGERGNEWHVREVPPSYARFQGEGNRLQDPI